MATKEKTMFSVEETAAIFAVPRSKVDFWITTNQLHAINTAGKPDGRPRYRIEAEEIERFKESRRVRPFLDSARRKKAAMQK